MIENIITYFDAGLAVEKWFESVQTFAPHVIGALIMGAIGSVAYYVALRLGFVGGEQREWLIENFDGPASVVGFIIIGGAVALVFQLPDPKAFVPIQSFVLGVTWPIIVGQYVSRVEAPAIKGLVAELRREGET